MSSDKAKVHPLFAVPDADAAPDETPSQEVAARPFAAEPAVCQFCYGSGMEVVAGKGARRCRCRTQGAQGKLLEAARIPRRYNECSLHNYYPMKGNGTQLRAFQYAWRRAREYP